MPVDPYMPADPYAPQPPSQDDALAWMQALQQNAAPGASLPLQPGLGIPSAPVDAVTPPAPPQIGPQPGGAPLPEWSQPGATGAAQWEFPGWDPHASEADQQAAFEAANAAAPNINGGIGPSGAPRSDALPYGANEPPPAPMPFGPQSEPAHDKYLDTVGDVHTEGTPAQEEAHRYEAFMSGKLSPTAHADAFALLSPEDQARAVESGAATGTEAIKYGVHREATINAKIDADLHEAELARQKNARENLQFMTAAATKADVDTKQAMVDATKLAATKVNPNRYTQNRSLGRTIFEALASGIGGLAMNYTGGHNLVLDAIDKNIDNDIAAQKDDIANQWRGIDARKSEIAQEYARHGDMYRAQETYGIAVYQGLISDAKTKLQELDPAGGQALKIRGLIDGATERVTQRAQALNDHTFEHNLKVAKDARDAADLEEKIRKDKADESLAWTKEAREGAKAKAEDQVYSPAVLQAIYKSQGTDIPLPPKSMSLKEHKALIENVNAVQEGQTKARANSPEDRARQLAVGEIVDSTGAPVLFRNDTVAADIAGGKAALDSGARLIDKITLARAKYGWSSDLVRSPEWREAQADYSALLLQKKNTDHLGVLSDSDIELEGRALGTKDPTEVRDPTPGLMTARKNMVDDFNDKAGAQAVLPTGRKLKRYEPVELTKLPPAPPTPIEEITKALEHSMERSDHISPEDAEFSKSQTDNDLAGSKVGKSRGEVRDHALLKRAYAEGIYPSKLKLLDELTAQLRDPELASAARAALNEQAANGTSAGIRKYAQHALTQVDVFDRIGNEPAGPYVPDPADQAAAAVYRIRNGQ